jgi:signal transduction histidine kinase
MKPLPVRIRLTAWYLGVTAFVCSIAFIAVYFGMLEATEHMVNSELRARTREIGQFLADHSGLHHGTETWDDEFDKSSGVEPSHELYQLKDASGSWLFQAPAMKLLNIPARSPDRGRREQIATISRRRNYVRVLTSIITVGNNDYLVQVATIVTPLYEEVALFKWVALSALLLTLLGSGLGGYWLSGRSMRPVHDLATTARLISESNLEQRLPHPRADDELGELTAVLNDMLSRLDAAFTRIKQFTADASHELRTPVTVIRTTAEVAMERPRSHEEYREMIGLILRESEFISELVENLLTLAREDAKPGSLTLSRVDARSMVDEIAPEVRALAANRTLTFESSNDSVNFDVLVDKRSFRQLLMILCDNACRYTKPDGVVTMTLQREGEAGFFTVKDSGIGIAQEDIDRICDRFFRGANARAIDAEGAGLGLSIARSIAAAHHAQLEIASAPGTGTMVRVKIPILWEIIPPSKSV